MFQILKEHCTSTRNSVVSNMGSQSHSLCHLLIMIRQKFQTITITINVNICFQDFENNFDSVQCISPMFATKVKCYIWATQCYMELYTQGYRRLHMVTYMGGCISQLYMVTLGYTGYYTRLKMVMPCYKGVHQLHT